MAGQYWQGVFVLVTCDLGSYLERKVERDMSKTAKAHDRVIFIVLQSVATHEIIEM